MPYLFDTYYLILVVPALLVSLACQAMVSAAFGKYSKVANARKLTGAAAAKELLRRSGVYDVSVEQVHGRLTDHYDPRSKTLRLSQSVYGSASVAAVGVAAHEAGHAIQHAESYAPLGLRSALVPVAGIGSGAGPYLALFGLIAAIDWLVTIGILLFTVAVLFYLVTLPVEFDASRRALARLYDYGILSGDELAGSKKVLRAAAMTYVASALVAVASLARLLLQARGRGYGGGDGRRR